MSGTDSVAYRANYLRLFLNLEKLEFFARVSNCSSSDSESEDDADEVLLVDESCESTLDLRLLVVVPLLLLLALSARDVPDCSFCSLASNALGIGATPASKALGIEASSYFDSAVAPASPPPAVVLILAAPAASCGLRI